MIKLIIFIIIILIIFYILNRYILNKDVKEIFDLIEDEETLYVTRDAHTEGLTFGEIVTEPWSAYEGTPKCKDILKLTPEECASELILNSGVIAGHRKAILGLESELFKMLPLSKFYFNENSKYKNFGGGIISIPPGHGKTILAIYIACMLNVKTLVVVHKSFLVTQWIDKNKEFTNAKIGIIR